jgi:hypothetical protein
MSISKVNGQTIIAAVGGGYSLQGSLVSLSSFPSSNTDYYGGDSFSTALSTTAQSRRIYIPKSGTIKTCYGFFSQTAQAFNAVGDLHINVNNGAYTLISQENHLATTSLYSNTSLSISVTLGDYIEFRWRCPYYAPGSVLCEFVVYVE